MNSLPSADNMVNKLSEIHQILKPSQGGQPSMNLGGMPTLNTQGTLPGA